MKKGAFRFPMIKVEGGSSPDPAVYCPANGYILNEPEYIPPEGVILPDSSVESIILICNSAYSNIFTSPSLTKVGTGNFLFEYFSLDGTLIDSKSVSTVNLGEFTFPYIGYIIVKISLVNPSAYFSVIASGLSTYSFYVEKIIFNTPKATNLANCCRWMEGLLSVEFNCSLNFVTSFANAFQYSGIYEFVFQNSYNALASTQYMFSLTPNLYRIVFPNNCYLPVLSNMSYFCDSSNVDTLLLPDEILSLINAPSLARYARKLKTIRFFVNIPNCTTLSSAFEGTGLSGEHILPIYNPTLTGVRMYADNPLITKITFIAPTTVSLCNFQNIITGCRKLTEITFPETFGGYNGLSLGISSPILKRLGMPYLLVAGSTPSYSTAFPAVGLLEEVVGDMDNTDSSEVEVVFTSLNNTLRIINMPKLRVSAINIANSISAAYMFSKLETLEVDWANSSFSTTPGAYGVNIFINADVSGTWLDNLMAKLPIMERSIRISSCSGFATCDTTIATAKGWTVV